MNEATKKWRCPYCDGLNDWQNEVCEICGDGRRNEGAAAEKAAEPIIMPKTYTPPEHKAEPEAPRTEPERETRTTYAPPPPPAPEPKKKKKGGFLITILIVALAYGGGKLLGGQLAPSMTNNPQPQATQAFQATLSPTQNATPQPTVQPTTQPTPKPTQAITQAPTPEPVTLKQGDSGDAVAALQAELIERNYLADTADGIFGGKTAAAVKQVQAEAGLAQTGVADVATQVYLQSHTGPFNPTRDADLLMYALSCTLDDHRLYLFLKNNGRQDITYIEVNLEQCNDGKAALGSFYGKRNNKNNTFGSYHFWTNTLRSGEANYRFLDLKEGSTVMFDDGTLNTITYFENSRYARVTLKKYKTADGKEHSANQVLYCPFR